jgi:serine/threonine-protein kinase
MLAGYPPFEEFETVGQIIVAICSSPAPDLALVAPHVPLEVTRVVQRALRMDPTERFASADDMYDALCALLPRGVAIAEAELHELSRASSSPPSTTRGVASCQETLKGYQAPPLPSRLPPLGLSTPASGKTPRVSEGTVTETLRSGSPLSSSTGSSATLTRRRSLFAVLGVAALVASVALGRGVTAGEPLQQTADSARPAALAKSRDAQAPTAVPAVASILPRVAPPEETEPERAPAARAPQPPQRGARAGHAPAARAVATAVAPREPAPAGVPDEARAAPPSETTASSFSTLDKNFE